MTQKNSERKMLEALGYILNDRTFLSIWRIIQKSGMFRRGQFSYSNERIVYSGAEHRGNPKLPNLTFLPYLLFEDDLLMSGTPGHQHTQAEKGDTRRFQEIYESLGYGAMLLRNSEGTTLHILKPKDKVIVGTADNMSIINLDHSPLITLDYANPEMNSANRDLEARIGPLMIITQHIDSYEANTTLFKINQKYIEEDYLKPDETIKVSGYVYPRNNAVPPSEFCKFIVCVEHTKSGAHLYDELGKGYAKEFKKLGINLVFGGNIPSDLKDEFFPPLLELVLRRNKTFMEILQIR